MRTLVIGCIIGLVASPALAMDCSNAASRVEKTICTDSNLKTLDEKLGALYTKAHNEGQDPWTLKIIQQNWLAERNACKDKDCIEEAYQNRIYKLTDYVDAVNIEDRARVDFIPVSEASKQCIRIVPMDAPNITTKCTVKAWKPLGKVGAFNRFFALYHLRYTYNGQDIESDIPAVFAHNPDDASVVAFDVMAANIPPQYAGEITPRVDGSDIVFDYRTLDDAKAEARFQHNAKDDTFTRVK